MKVLTIQTAFIGDVILTLPLVQVLKREMPGAVVDFMCIPSTNEILSNNPYINEVLVYDKRNSGMKGIRSIVKEIKKRNYDIIITPHRSFRTSLICFMSGVKKTISFDISAMSLLYKKAVLYVGYEHEIKRNLHLLEPLGIKEDQIIPPELFPSADDKKKVDELMDVFELIGKKFVCIAPGSIWFTKRYPKEKYANVVKMLEEKGIPVVLIGGEKDKEIGDYIHGKSKKENVFNVTGKLSLLESAEMIRRADVLLTNDSAPLHIANAMGTRVIAIFGATVPEFGFYPYGDGDVIFETKGLKCRPCSIHGGYKCPIGTFDCMMRIEEGDVAGKIEEII